MASELILITGVSGFIGFKTLIISLEAGNQVRAVVRKPDQIPKLQNHPKIQSHVKRIGFVVVPDLSQSTSFDPFLEGLTGILHVASPLAIETDDYERDIIQPAIDVTKSILKAASRASSVKRVTITSSGVTLIPFEALSNLNSTQIVTEKDLNVSPTRPTHSSMEAYWAAKALSRIAAHEYLTNQQPHFEIIDLLPTVVMGPDALAITTSSLLVGTRALALAPILGQKIESPLIGVQVHVDDVARAHVDALNASIPGNRDYVLTADGIEGMVWEDGKELVRDLKGVEGALPLSGSMPTLNWRIDASGTEKAFGWKFQSFEVTMRNTVKQYLEFRE